MSASSSGALKARLEGAGLGLAWFRDEAPAGQAMPYGVIHEGISIVPEAMFNAKDDDAGHVSELVQVDVWQEWRSQSSRGLTETPSLKDSVIRALHGALLPTAPKLVFECSVLGSVRMLMRDDNRVKNAITVRIRRLM